jgi:hypothetical protein
MVDVERKDTRRAVLYRKELSGAKTRYLIVSRAIVHLGGSIYREHRFSPPLVARVRSRHSVVFGGTRGWLGAWAIMPVKGWGAGHEVVGTGMYTIPVDYDQYGYALPSIGWRPESAAMRRKRLRDARKKGKP